MIRLALVNYACRMARRTDTGIRKMESFIEGKREIFTGYPHPEA